MLLLQACDWLWPLQESQLLPNQVLSEQQSSVVIRKLLAIAVSGITYLRGLFPEKAYGNKYVEGYMTRTRSLTSWCMNGPGTVSSHRSESDDPQGGRQLSWDNSDCSVVNNNSKLAAAFCLLGGALTVQRRTKINVWYDDRNGRKKHFFCALRAVKLCGCTCMCYSIPPGCRGALRPFSLNMWVNKAFFIPSGYLTRSLLIYLGKFSWSLLSTWKRVVVLILMNVDIFVFPHQLRTVVLSVSILSFIIDVCVWINNKGKSR